MFYTAESMDQTEDMSRAMDGPMEKKTVFHETSRAKRIDTVEQTYLILCGEATQLQAAQPITLW